MDKKTTGIIATVVTALLCGCPGLCLCAFGAYAATGNMPWTWDLSGNITSGNVPSYIGFIGLCLALIFIAIPIVVGVLTLRKKPEQTVTFNEPMPPTA
jgi:hypothetical protein